MGSEMCIRDRFRHVRARYPIDLGEIVPLFVLLPIKSRLGTGYVSSGNGVPQVHIIASAMMCDISNDFLRQCIRS